MFGVRHLVVLSLVVIGAILALSSVRLRSTEVDIDATLQAMSFTVAGDKAVTLAPFVVTDVTFYGSGQVVTRGAPASFQSTFGVSKKSSEGALMTLQGLKLQPGAKLRIRKRPGNEHPFELEVEANAPPKFQLLVQGQVEAKIDSRPWLEQSLSPHTFDINLPEGPVTFTLKLAETEWSERRAFNVSALSFFDGGDNDGVPFRFGALDRGHLRFSEIQWDDGRNRELELRVGQPFILKPLPSSTVRYLKLSQTGIVVQFSGAVSDIATGWDDHTATSHMPSYLALVTSKDWVKQALSGLIAAFGLLLTYFQPRTGAHNT